MKNKTPIPCGSSLPLNNPHAVSVHFQTIADVIAFEENDMEMINRMESGYPRFKMNRLLEKAYNFVRDEYKIPSDIELLPVASDSSLETIKNCINGKIEKVEYGNLKFAKLEKNSDYFADVKYLIQHTGIIPSSRAAEDFLLERGLINCEFAEEKLSAKDSESRIKNTLLEAYGFADADDIFLCSAGMNAVYSVFESIKKARKNENRNVFIQAGWLYLDTMEILRKYSDTVFRYFNPLKLEELEKYIELHKNEIAAIFTEIPNNPSIQCYDLPKLSEIARKYDIALVVDSTMATPYNAHIFPYADVAVESLTKFACGHGDVLMGGIVINNQSKFADVLRTGISKIHQPPYIKDIRRLAFEIQSYKERVKKVSENTLALGEYFKQKPQVKKISWVLDDLSKENFAKIRKSESSVPGLIALIFDKELSYYFDRLNLAKGPSLGTDFTLAMPYVYLAHYSLLKTEEGRALMSDNGIDTELLRLSVGLENVEDIISAFEEVLG